MLQGPDFCRAALLRARALSGALEYQSASGAPLPKICDSGSGSGALKKVGALDKERRSSIMVFFKYFFPFSWEFCPILVPFLRTNIHFAYILLVLALKVGLMRGLRGFLQFFLILKGIHFQNLIEMRAQGERRSFSWEGERERRSEKNKRAGARAPLRKKWKSGSASGALKN